MKGENKSHVHALNGERGRCLPSWFLCIDWSCNHSASVTDCPETCKHNERYRIKDLLQRLKFMHFRSPLSPLRKAVFSASGAGRDIRGTDKELIMDRSGREQGQIGTHICPSLIPNPTMQELYRRSGCSAWWSCPPTGPGLRNATRPGSIGAGGGGGPVTAPCKEDESADPDDMCELWQWLHTCSECRHGHALTSGFQVLPTDFSCG